MPGSLVHIYIFLEIGTKLLCLKGNRHLPGASAYLSIKVNRSEMSLREAGAGPARSNEAEMWSMEMTKGQQCVLKTRDPREGMALFPSGWFSAGLKFLTQTE